MAKGKFISNASKSSAPPNPCNSRTGRQSSSGNTMPKAALGTVVLNCGGGGAGKKVVHVADIFSVEKTYL
jgi:hypothetical protein